MSKPRLVHVPTVDELVELGLAKKLPDKRYKIKPKGYDLIKTAQANNAYLIAVVEHDVAAAREVLHKAEIRRKKLLDQGKEI